MNSLIKKKLDLITCNCEEILTQKDLENLLLSKTKLKHYIGFEISGKVHLGTGLMSMGKIADFLKAGAECTIFLADFHSYLNNKLGGNWENIRIATNGYFKNGLAASLKCFGIKEEQVRFVTGKDLYKNNLLHWETFMEVGKHLTLSRNLRSVSIMGKKLGNQVDMATLFYPPLQVADIFTLGVNLAHAGVDQRKAHVIARMVAPKLKINPLLDKKEKVISPIAIHQNTIAGLDGPGKTDLDQDKDQLAINLKMSKSKPDSAIFIHDSPAEIKEKIRKAYCPPGEIEFNPLINWVKYLIFWGQQKGDFKIERAARFGGSKVYYEFSKLSNDYQEGSLHPQDLKAAAVKWLVAKLAPARKHFLEPKAAQSLIFLEKAML